VRLVVAALVVAAPATGSVRAQSSLPASLRIDPQQRSLPPADARNPFSTDDLAVALDAAGLDRALLGSQPRGEATSGSLPLSLRDVVDRALELNLGVLLRQDAVEAARGGMIEARADLLPQLTAEIADRRLEFNFDASAFRGFGEADRDPVVDYEIFDARLFLRAPLYDAVARWDARAAAERYAAAAVVAGEIRAAAVLFVGNLYLRVAAQAVRAEAVEAQVETAEALLELARDAAAAGLAPAIDALRAEVRLRGEQQRLVAERNELAKSKLRLGRTIGLPPAQELHITELLGYVPVPALDARALVAEALRVRPDLRALEAGRREALARRRAARGERLPVLDVQADIGELGPAADETRTTMGAAARLRVPLFDGGRTRGELLRADAELRSLEARIASLRDAVVVDVRAALLDAEAAELEIQLAASAAELAARQLEQARNRFAAGVGAHLEVVEAQETAAQASEREVAALLSQRLAKGAIARAIGMDEHAILAVLANDVRPLRRDASAGIPRPRSPEDRP
jgi:outer membrane protein TolC